MLHAELYGKLDDTSTDLSRREDILTSTVFGTLLIADEGTDLLAGWLNCARCLGPEGRLSGAILPTPARAPVSYWFWPGLAEAEPDLVLRIGERLFILEAKYASRKSASAPAEPDEITLPSDQLARQWRSCNPANAGTISYHPHLREAMCECERVLVYLVSVRHLGRAVAEIRASQEAIQVSGIETGEIPLYLLTWQDLHRVLRLRMLREPAAPAWVAELARLLADRRHLGAFAGFPMTLTGTHQGTPAALQQWTGSWQRKAQRFVDFSALLIPLDLDAVRMAPFAWKYSHEAAS